MKVVKEGKLWMVFALVIVFIFPLASGCDETEAAIEKLVFADAGWESIRLHNYVAGIIIEEGMRGYEQDVMSGSTPATFSGLRRGEIDIYMEIWQENIQAEYKDAIDQGDIEVLGVNFDDNAQGLYVPTFVIEGDPERDIEPMAPGLRSVFDLPEYWEIFKDPEDASKGRVVGAPSEWAVDEILETKMSTYGLDETFNYFRPGSEATLNTAIVSAYERGEAIVAYNWEPTWIMGRFEMTLLEEPEFDEEEYFQGGYATEIPSMDVTIAVNNELRERAPNVVDFLEQYTTSSEITSEALAYMENEGVGEREAAKWFLKTYEEIWTEWVSEEVADNVLAYLDEHFTG